MAVSFWDRALFEFYDALNRDIFDNSVQVQIREIGKTSSTCGAQQAMVRPDPLRWILDPVGVNWKSAEAILFCGSSYAGIFSPFSSRPGARTMPVEKYAEADTLKAFQGVFFDNIIDPPTPANSRDRRPVPQTDAYYGPIEKLSACLPNASYIVLFDLCRASFVRRLQVNGTVKDKSSDRVIRDACATFVKYVESDTPSEWLWRRISGGKARRLVALGSIAEHGLLRLFQRRGFSIYLKDLGPIAFPDAVLKANDGKWVADYAYEWLRHNDRELVRIAGPLQLEYWLRKCEWWSIRAEDSREIWRLLPVYHPTSRRLTGTRLMDSISLINSM
jgi:hypothetical protein